MTFEQLSPGYQLPIEHPFFIVAELIQTDEDRKNIAMSISEYKDSNPNKIRQESTEIDGEKMHITKFSSKDLPITMLGMDNRKSALDHNSCYARSASFGKWERIPIILTAVAIVSN